MQTNFIQFFSYNLLSLSRANFTFLLDPKVDKMELSTMQTHCVLLPGLAKE